jgi:hypothetical protein
LIVAFVGLLLSHEPPVAVVVSIMDSPLQMVERPSIVPTAAFTLIAAVRAQPALFVYVIVDVPSLMPVAKPVAAVTEAAPGLLLLHVHPPMPPERFRVEPTQTMLLPVYTAGKAFTVIIPVTVSGVTPLVVVYVITLVPAAKPVATPVTGFTVATVVLLLVQVPPATGCSRLVLLPTHIFRVPDTTVGDGVTLTTVLAVAVPQLLVTV